MTGPEEFADCIQNQMMFRLGPEQSYVPILSDVDSGDVALSLDLDAILRLLL